MPVYCGKRSAGICVVVGPKKSSTYSSEYASGFFEPAASHLSAAPSPRNEGLLGQAPRLAGLFTSWVVASLLWPLSLAMPATTPLFASNVSEADSLTVNVESGGGIRAMAQVFFPAKPEIIQAILTDYGHWPELFDVRMKVASLAIEHGVATTDLRIEHALLPGERRLVSESRTLPNGGLMTDLKAGDFKRYHRVWKLGPAGGGNRTKAEFELVVEIDSIVPDWLVALAMRRELEAHFRIVKEKALARANEGR
jgi:hypothetical protein